MKPSFFFFILSLFFSGNPAYAQKQGQARIDSLLRQLPNLQDDTNKVSLLQNLSFTYQNSDPDEGIKYGQQGLVLAQKLEWKSGMGKIYNAIGANYQRKSDFPQALDYYHKSLHIYEELGNKRNMAYNFANIGIVYLSQSDYPRALEYLFKGLKINEELGNKVGMANALVNIGTIYRQEKDLSKALEYYLKALSKQEELGDKANIAINLGNIGVAYYDQNKYAASLEYYLKSLKMMEELGNKNGMARIQANIGGIFIAQHKYSAALQYLSRALKINEELGNKESVATDLSGIGDCYLQIAKDTITIVKPDSLIPARKTAILIYAIDYLNKSNKTFKEIGDLDDLQRNTKNLSDAHALLGNYEDALENYKKSVAVKDSVFNTENNIKITQLETQRSLDLKDRDIEIKNKQLEIDKLAVAKKRNERGFFIAGILILIAVAFVIFRNYKKLSAHKNEIEKLRAVSNERTRIASDMHDDLGAGLTSIRLLSEIAMQKTSVDNIVKPEIEKIARSAGDISENLREIIWTMNVRYDRLEDFIIYVRGYAVEFFDNAPINFQFNKPAVVPELTMSGDLRRNIFLCIKEALNNIVKHSGATDAALTFGISGNSLIVEIKDNGKGIDVSRVSNFGSGLSTMKERLNKFGGDLQIDVNRGTIIIFKIKISNQ